MLVSPLHRESFPSASTVISRSGFLFLLFLCPKKDFVKDVFLIRLAKSRECRPSFCKKSLIFFSSKREKSVEYRVRGTFPEKSFHQQVVKPEKSVE